MFYTLKHAAEATGKSKPTILRAIQTGKISARKDVNGEWEIDPAELHRVYAPVTVGGTVSGTPDALSGTDETLQGTTVLQVEIALLRELLIERDKRVADQATVIGDLMVRLDQEATDRRRAHAQLTGLLTDQRTVEKVPIPRWYRWW